MSFGVLRVPLIGAYKLLRRSPLAVAALVLPLITAWAVSFLMRGYQQDVAEAMGLAAQGDRVTALAWIGGDGSALQVGTQKGRIRLVARDGSVRQGPPDRERGPIVTIFPGSPRSRGILPYTWLTEDSASILQNDGDGGVGIPISTQLSFVINGTIRIVAEGNSADGPPTGNSTSKGFDKSDGAEAQQRAPSPPSRHPDQFPAALPGTATGAARVSAIAVLRAETGMESVVAGYDNGIVRSTNASGDVSIPASREFDLQPPAEPIIAIATGVAEQRLVFVCADAKGQVLTASTSPGSNVPPEFSSAPLSWSAPRMSPPAKDGLFLSRNSTVLMVYGEDGSVAIARSPFRTSEGKEPALHRYEFDVLERTSAAALSPRGDLFALAGNNGVIRIVLLPADESAAPSAARILTVTGHADIVTHLAISDDGRYLASSGIDGRLLLTDLDQAIRFSQWPLFDLATGPTAQEMRPSPILIDAPPITAAPPSTPSAANAPPSILSGSARTNSAIPSSVAIDGRDDFAVLFGSDETLEGAQDEIARAKVAGFASAAIYRRGPWYTSIITFPTADSRAEGLPVIQSLSKTARSARPLKLSDWCPRRRPAQGYFDCGGAPADLRQ